MALLFFVAWRRVSLALLLLLASAARAQAPITATYAATALPLVHAQRAATLCIDPRHAAVVRVAAEALAGDIALVAGVRPTVRAGTGAPAGPAVLMGTLGHSGLMSAHPRDQKVLEMLPVADLAHAPYVEYKAELSAGVQNIAVRCLPTFGLYAGRGLHYALTVNGDSPQVVDMNVPADSPQQKENGLCCFSQGQTRHQVAASEPATIRVYLLDPGLVVNQLQLD